MSAAIVIDAAVRIVLGCIIILAVALSHRADWTAGRRPSGDEIAFDLAMLAAGALLALDGWGLLP